MPSLVWDKAEVAEMHDIIPLYGKTYHFWQVDRGDAVPLGPPQLMSSFLSDETVAFTHPEGTKDLLKERDERFGISFEEKRAQREEIQSVHKHPGLFSQFSRYVFLLFVLHSCIVFISDRNFTVGLSDADIPWKEYATTHALGLGLDR